MRIWFFDLGERSRYVNLSVLICILFAEHHSWRFFNSSLHFASRLVNEGLLMNMQVSSAKKSRVRRSSVLKVINVNEKE